MSRILVAALLGAISLSACAQQAPSTAAAPAAKPAEPPAAEAAPAPGSIRF